MNPTRTVLLLLLSLAALLGSGPSAVAAAADGASPRVISRSPQPGGVAGTGDVIIATFDEPVRNVSADTFTLRNAAGVRLDAAVSWDEGSRTAVLRPVDRLTVARAYTVNLRSGITDLAGNALAPLAWSFTTSGRVSFPAGAYTGYRFDPEKRTFRAVKRYTLGAASSANATRFRRINGQGFLLIADGVWAGYWVHGLRWGRARDDASAPTTFLPACSYADLPTARTGYAQWATAVMDTLYALPSAYAPSDLVDTSRAGLNGGHLVRSVAITDLRAMADAARSAGADLAVQSSYRSYRSQVATFDHWRRLLGYEEALKVSARPGHSEHQLGTTIDFRTANGPAPWDLADWGATREGAWMKANAWRFGWVLSYPQNAMRNSCYSYEPWHYRYVGRELAAAIHAAAMVPRVYLWSRGYGIR